MLTHNFFKRKTLATGTSAILLCLTGTTLSFAAELKLNGAQIKELLPKIEAIGENTHQIFSPSGDTTYVTDGRPSFGSWRVEGDQYCSVWPPSGSWDCYDIVVIDGTLEKPAVINWIGASNDVTTNELKYR